MLTAPARFKDKTYNLHFQSLTSTSTGLIPCQTPQAAPMYTSGTGYPVPWFTDDSTK